MIALPCIVALALQSPAGPTLVPETPADWVAERLEFPLGFAPDIALEGVEELRFAPGMFDPASATHWTYLFGLDVRPRQDVDVDVVRGTRIPQNSELDVDAAFLEDFLLRYYRGLCGVVAGSSGLEIDLEAVRAKVVGGGASFQAHVELFDAFGDGAPLELALDFLVHPKANGVELLGLAAPKGASTEVRAELTALGEAWRAARPVPIFLNHVYMIPDLATYEALAASELLREIAVVEERTTVRADIEYTGLYLYGERTYLEFLKPNPEAGLVEGGTGLAFGVELPGGLVRVASSLEPGGIKTFADKKTREFEGQQVPWFDVLGFEAATTTQRLQLFAMEYDPQYLQRWHPPPVPEPPRIDRKAVLARTAAVLGAGDGAPSFDIYRVYLRLDGAETDRYTQLASELGLDAEQRVQFQMKAMPSPNDAPGRVFFVELNLSRSRTSHDSDFGQINLHISGHSAIFEFLEGVPAKESK